MFWRQSVDHGAFCPIGTTMTLDDMRLFAAVAEAESFTLAARALGVPKQTLSRRIGGLERSLGVRLLHRTTRRLRLSETGGAYAERCAELVRLAEEANRAVTDAQQVPRGTLRVTADPVFGEAFLPALIVDFAKRWPDSQVEVVLTRRRSTSSRRASTLPSVWATSRRRGSPRGVWARRASGIVPVPPKSRLRRVCGQAGDARRAQPTSMHSGFRRGRGRPLAIRARACGGARGSRHRHLSRIRLRRGHSSAQARTCAGAMEWRSRRRVAAPRHPAVTQCARAGVRRPRVRAARRGRGLGGPSAPRFVAQGARLGRPGLNLVRCGAAHSGPASGTTTAFRRAWS